MYGLRSSVKNLLKHRYITWVVVVPLIESINDHFIKIEFYEKMRKLKNYLKSWIKFTKGTINRSNKTKDNNNNNKSGSSVKMKRQMIMGMKMREMREMLRE